MTAFIFSIGNLKKGEKAKSEELETYLNYALFTFSPFYLFNSLRFLLDCNLSAIVTAGRANGVIDVELAAVRAYCQCGCYCLVVSSSFESPGLGLSSFRMCHIIYNLTMYDVQFIFTIYFLLFFLVRPIAGHSLPPRGRGW